MNAETRIQKNLISWWALACRAYNVDARYLAHVPNGGKRGLLEACILKAMGVRRGHEDLFLAIPIKQSHGLYLEVKAPGGRTSPDQKEMMQLHRDQGYAVMVAWSFDEGVRAITNYLKTGDPLLRS